MFAGVIHVSNRAVLNVKLECLAVCMDSECSESDVMSLQTTGEHFLLYGKKPCVSTVAQRSYACERKQPGVFNAGEWREEDVFMAVSWMELVCVVC